MLHLKVGAINGQTGIIMHVKFAHGSAGEVYVKFSYEQDGSKAMRSFYLGKKPLEFLLKNVKLRFQ